MRRRCGDGLTSETPFRASRSGKWPHLDRPMSRMRTIRMRFQMRPSLDVDLGRLSLVAG